MPSNLKVLLVDDNPMIRAMLRQALAPLATISTANDGGDALLKAIDDVPDLIISDYQMSGMDGRQLLEKIKGRASTSHIPVILLASKNDISDRLKIVQSYVEDFVEKPFFIADAVAQIKRIVDKLSLEKMAREAPGEAVVRGSLAQMSVIDLLQSLELGRKTCSLTISFKNDRCELFFNEGQIHHAVCGAVAGDEAVYQVLTWVEPGGSFQIDFCGKSPAQTTTRSTQGLLMEGLRLLDEANRDAEQAELEQAAPEQPAPLQVEPAAPEPAPPERQQPAAKPQVPAESEDVLET